MIQKVNLREERLNRGLSIRAMASEAGVSFAALQRAEEGKPVHPRNAHAIATFLGYKVTEIWPVDDEEPAAA